MTVSFISFNIDGQIITRTDTTPIVRDSINYLWAEFRCSDEWEGTITAVFKGADGQAFNVLLGRGECKIPWEVLTQPWFEVSAFCGNLITANVVRIYTIKSGYEIGEESRQPTPDVFNQIIGAIDNINAYTVPYENSDLGVENVGEALNVLAEGGGGGGGGTTPNIHMTAEVDATTGTPDVEVTKTGTLTNPIFNLAFTGLKGETGSQGPQGIQGIQGPQGPAGADGSVVTVTQTLSSGTKIAEVSVDGTVTNLYAPSGSGGATSLSGLSDVQLSQSIGEGQALRYDSTSGKWVNAPITPHVELTQLTEITLEPNRFYNLPEATELDISFNVDYSLPFVQEFHFLILSGSTPTELLLPSDILVPDDFAIEANKIYEISIMNSLLLYSSWTMPEEETKER